MSIKEHINALGDIEKYAFPKLKPLEQDANWAHKYCYDILKGNIPSCVKMKWVAIRHFKDLQRDDLYWDDKAAESIVLWFSFCPIVKGSKSGTPMILDPSQIFISCSLIAWKWSDDKFEFNEEFNEKIQIRHAHKRRYNQLYAQVSRKYGKTSWTAGIKLYLMHKYAFGGRVYSLATKKDQAKEVWNVAKKMIKLSPDLSSIFLPRANDILQPAKEGEFKPLASDSNSLDGLDPIAACLDECHAIKDRNLYGVLISAFGSNEGGEYLFSVITTAGFILDGLCTDIYKNGERVLNPDTQTEQDNYFYVIFEIDKDDNWEDEKSWYKSNPALIYGRPAIQYMRDRYQEATMSISEKANFLTKHCNIFVNSSDTWLNYDEVKKCSRPELDFDDYIGRKCYVGIDRALVGDITSAVPLFPDADGGCTIFPFNMQSKGAFDEAGDYLRSMYMKAEAEEDLEIINGNTVKNTDVKELVRYLWDILDDCEGFFYDPYHMREVALELETEGIPMIAVSQGTGNMAEPSLKLESLIKEGLFRYNGSVLFEFGASCAQVGITKNNNMHVYRDTASYKTEKIDPLIATIIALSAATLIKQDEFVYNDRGMLFL